MNADKRAMRARRTDIHGRDYFVWVASAGLGDSCGHDHPTKALATECAQLRPSFDKEQHETTWHD